MNPSRTRDQRRVAVQSTGVATDDLLRMEITDDDVRAAKKDWLRARDHGAPVGAVDSAFWFYSRLISTQAQQLADDVRRARGRTSS